MGMDVYGKRPRSEAGEYFRASVWSWYPLWEYCCRVAPELTGKVKYGHSNDGDGLGDADAVRLAEILQSHADAGECRRFADERRSFNASLPDEPCRICGGTGKRLPPPDCGPGTLPCNGCGGRGHVRPFGTEYVFDVDRAQRFAAFLRDCGGFEIC